jgi:hypothetical protein
MKGYPLDLITIIGNKMDNHDFIYQRGTHYSNLSHWFQGGQSCVMRPAAAAHMGPHGSAIGGARRSKGKRWLQRMKLDAIWIKMEWGRWGFSPATPCGQMVSSEAEQC